MLTERDLSVLTALDRYYVLNREQIQRLCFPGDPSGRITRRRLQSLHVEHYINRQRFAVYNPALGTPAPVYYPSRKGAEFLAAHFDDERFLAATTQAPNAQHLLHWLAVSETHLTLDAAIARQDEVQLAGWLNEWDTVNRAESAPERRYRIYTLIREAPRLVCAPDAAFLLELRGHRKVYYLEQDRNTSGVRQIAASKTPGYAAMAEQKLHLRHFPQATVETFAVLLITTTPSRREALRKGIQEKPGAALWRFATTADVTPERFLHAAIFSPCVGEAVPLVKPSGGASPAGKAV